MKTDRKVATAEEVLVAKGKNLVPNVTDTVAMSSPATGCLCKSSQQPGSFWPHEGGEGLYPLEPSTDCLLFARVNLWNLLQVLLLF